MCEVLEKATEKQRYVSDATELKSHFPLGKEMRWKFQVNKNIKFNGANGSLVH